MGRKRSQRNQDDSAVRMDDPAIPAEPQETKREQESTADAERRERPTTQDESLAPNGQQSSGAPPSKSGGRKRKRRRRKKPADIPAPTPLGEPAQADANEAIAQSESAGEPQSPEAGSSGEEHSERSGSTGSGRKRKRRRKKRSASDSAASEPRTPVPDAGPPEEKQTGPAEQAEPEETEADAGVQAGFKVCLYCGEAKPLGDFLRRTGKRSGGSSRRGACRDCRKRRRAAGLEGGDGASDPMPPSAAAQPPVALPDEDAAAEAVPKRRIRRPLPEPPADALLEPTREGELRPTRQGTIRMRGRTDKGRRWQQETDLEMARCLVREHAAVVVNRFTIRRLYTNRSFRRYILERDRYTCHFCGEYGDTIDHLLPRAKGGRTTPLNCVCACMLCNQNKADRDLDEFMEDAEPIDL